MNARLLTVLAITGGSLIVMSGSAKAQTSPFNPYGGTSSNITRPPYSPYLNLLRNGNSAAVNYYGLVRPEIDYRNNLNQINRDVTGLRRDVGNLRQDVQDGSSTVPGTGHGVSFLNTRGYFFNLGSASSSSGSSGTRSSSTSTATTPNRGATPPTGYTAPQAPRRQ